MQCREEEVFTVHISLVLQNMACPVFYPGSHDTPARLLKDSLFFLGDLNGALAALADS